MWALVPGQLTVHSFPNPVRVTVLPINCTMQSSNHDNVFVVVRHAVYPPPPRETFSVTLDSEPEGAFFFFEGEKSIKTVCC